MLTTTQRQQAGHQTGQHRSSDGVRRMDEVARSEKESPVSRVEWTAGEQDTAIVVECHCGWNLLH